MDRYVNNNFNPNISASIGVDFASIKSYRAKSGEKCRIKIWDTCGLEKAKSLTKQFLNNADGVILGYDVTNRGSFANINSWLWHIGDSVGLDIPIIIVGNKIDLARLIEAEDAQSLAEENERSYHETSAKTGEGVKQMMDDIFEQAYTFVKAQ
mmetsp:Transcript_15864/g.18848  ORF Transcript_15864/g.18848 Transcript_15864/m.18848 type:complete len:153 (-) Transcript_15864:252-710(-)